MRITKRDEEIFRFLLDQKFAPLDAIYLRFFDRRKHPRQPMPPQLFVTRQRLLRLEKAGLLAKDKVFTASRSLYLLSPKGYQYLKQYTKEPPYAIPTKHIDFRNYLHDVRVTYCRIALERARKAISWYPERRVRMKGYTAQGEMLPDTVIPDGIFLSYEGERVAFELECSERKLRRFEFKASEYESLIYRKFIHRVFWIASDPSIERVLRKVAGRKPKFTIGNYSEFTNQLFPEGLHDSRK
jgi:hypothetical protein